MIVELKKVKITTSILKQLQYATMPQIEAYEVIGYVVVKAKRFTTKWILLYQGGTNTLVYIYYPRLLEVRSESNPYKYHLSYISDYGTTMYQDKEQSRGYAQRCFDVSSLVKSDADRKGQIFY